MPPEAVRSFALGIAVFLDTLFEHETGGILGDLFSNPMHDVANLTPASGRQCRALSLAHSALFTGLGEEDRILLSHLLSVAAGALDPALIMLSHAQDNRENILTFLTAIFVGRHRLLQ